MLTFASTDYRGRSLGASGIPHEATHAMETHGPNPKTGITEFATRLCFGLERSHFVQGLETLSLGRCHRSPRNLAFEATDGRFDRPVHASKCPCQQCPHHINSGSDI